MTDDGWILYEHSSPAQYRDGEKYPVQWQLVTITSPNSINERIVRKSLNDLDPSRIAIAGLRWRPTGIWKEFAGPKVETYGDQYLNADPLPLWAQQAITPALEQRNANLDFHIAALPDAANNLLGQKERDPQANYSDNMRIGSSYDIVVTKSSEFDRYFKTYKAKETA